MFNMSLIAETYLAAAIDDSELGMTVIDGTDFPTPNFIAVISKSRSLVDLKVAEHVIITSKGGGADWTISARDALVTADPLTHSIGDSVLGIWSPLHLNQIVLFDKMISLSFGLLATGIVQSSLGGNDCLVKESATPDMKVRVLVGQGFFNRVSFELTTEWVSPLIVAPAAGFLRNDIIQIDNVGTPSLKAGDPIATPGPAVDPTPDAGNQLIGTIDLDENTTTLNDGVEIADDRAMLN